METSSNSTLIAGHGTRLMDMHQLALVPQTRFSTATHQVIPHHEVVGALLDTLGFRKIGVHNAEFAVSTDGNKMFGLVELSESFNGARFALGIRNSHDKSMRLALTVGYRVFVCSNMAFNGDFDMSIKHSKNMSLKNALAIGMDDCQRGFEPMVKTIEMFKSSQLSDDAAKLHIYRAFVDGEIELPKHLIRSVHDQYFNPVHDEFRERTVWSLTNAFTESLKTLDPVPQFKATARIAGFFGNPS